jgi:DNA-directed RNA polymerase subunit RPC12/RpoP
MKAMEESVVQKLDYRCPYCDRIISCEEFDFKIGENEITCPSCRRIFIKVVLDSRSEGEPR